MTKTHDRFDLLVKLRAYEAQLDQWIAVKNCGVGSHGFPPGNTCARGSSGNMLAGSERRRDAGKRRRKGPNNGRSHAERRKHRRHAGHENASRRKWQAKVEAGKGTAEDRALLKTQQKERKSLAKDIRDGRRGDLKDAAKDRKDVARSIRKDRATERKRQASERASQKQREVKETTKLERDQAKKVERLKAKHEAQLARASDSDALKARRARRIVCLSVKTTGTSGSAFARINENIPVRCEMEECGQVEALGKRLRPGTFDWVVLVDWRISVSEGQAWLFRSP